MAKPFFWHKGRTALAAFIDAGLPNRHPIQGNRTGMGR
jgi:hypothetical protein